MMNRNLSIWNSAEERLLSLLLEKNSTISEICECFLLEYENQSSGFQQLKTYDLIKSKIDSIKFKLGHTNKDQNDKLWKNIQQAVTEFKLSSVQKKVASADKKIRKILTFSDLHIPFVMEDEIRQVCEQNKDADIIVLNGDILDGYIFSTYSKTKKIAAIKEYIAAFNLVRYLSNEFPQVVIVSGNHDSRASRALGYNGFEKEASQIFRPDLLARIANGEELDEAGMLVHKHSFSNVIYQPQDSWYIRIGKTIFCHPDGFGNAFPGNTVYKLLDHFSQRISTEEFDSIVVGHTHKQYKGIVSNKLLIEQGCMAHALPYQFKADLRFKNAVNGYAIIIQDEHGNTDFNKSTFIYLGTHLPIKKEAL